MNIGGMGMRAALERVRRPRKKCNRCGLYYLAKEEKCPHCSELTEKELSELLDRIEETHQANSNLGFWFFVMAGLLILLIFAIY